MNTMNRGMRRFFALLGCPLLLVGASAAWLAAAPRDAQPNWVYPLIAGAGGIRSIPNAAEPPRKESSVVFDVTQLADPSKPAKGIDRMARLLNLYADHGVIGANDKRASTRPRFALVLHGNATAAALRDAAYEQQMGAKQNPSLPLLKRFRELGVEVYVCGQALAHKKYRPADVDPSVTIGVSAMNVLINKQNRGFAYLPFH